MSESVVTAVTLEQVKQWSPFVKQVCARFEDLEQPEVWLTPWQKGDLYKSVYQEVMALEDEKALYKVLRKNRYWHMARIAIRDLMGLAPLQEVMYSVSELADALVASSLEWNYQRFCERYGTPVGAESDQPQRLLVLGMGKLGGEELNFSSDIDLIFAYPERGETQFVDAESGKRTISNDQFFTRLGQALNKSLVDYTDDGFVYRVDMRLRPFGDAGPLVTTFSALEHYYEIHGRAWERYALVKARVMAGDASDAKYLFDILRPFVYRRYVDFSAMDSLRELKQMIAAQVRKKGMEQNVKLGAGGIREVEFIVQAYQLIHGGRDKRLQGRALLPMLARVVERGDMDAESAHRLELAYIYLRRVENRLQAWADQQTHDLPRSPEQQLMLAQSLGHDSYDGLMADLQVHRDFIEQQFQQVFADDLGDGEESAYREAWLGVPEQGEVSSEEAPAEDKVSEMLVYINRFKQGRAIQTLGSDGVERLNQVMPLIMKEYVEGEHSAIGLERVLSVIEAVVKRSVYLVLLKENTQAISHLFALCDVSAWLADMLVKYPALLDQLLDEHSLYAPLELEALLAESMAIVDSVALDEEEFMNQIRQWRHAQVFKVAAADVTGNVLVTKVSDYLTWTAEAVLNAVVEFAWRLMREKNGLPGGVDVDSVRNPFLILGYGKLGGIELGYGSDLDVVFLFEGLDSSAQAVSPSGRSLDNSIYFIRMGQKIVSLMTTMMPSGVLYDVDTRLRPNGASGLMVVDLLAYERYIENKAWVWEHQALVRARAVVGDQQGREAFESFRKAFLQRERDEKIIRDEVVSMREKMQKELDKSSATSFDLKQGRGGIVDIEFMMQYLVLAHSNQYPGLAEYSDNLRILEAVKEIGLLSEEQVDGLLDAYKTYRSKYHRVSLQNEKHVVDVGCYLPQRRCVESIWQALMLRS